MPLPLLLLGAATVVGAAVTVGHLNQKHQHKERLRMGRDDIDPHVGDKNGAEKLPSEVLTSDILVKPVPGSIVCCSVFSAFDHTGIWLDEDTIVELHGSGLIKAVSHKRFLHNRSGNAIFVACDSKGTPLIVEGTPQRTAAEVFSYREYDLLKNNCYRFSWYCVSGEEKQLGSFSDFNNVLAKHHGKKIYWDRADLS